MPPDLVAVEIREVRGLNELRWAEGLRVCLPAAVVAETRLADAGADRGAVTLTADLPRPAVHHVGAIRMRCAFTDKPPMSSRLPFSYHWVPGFIRHQVASFIGRRQRNRADVWAAFPRWPLDLSSDFLADWANGPSTRIARPTPVLLTHDLDSPEGVENLLHRFLVLEEKCQARSTSFVVPCAWPLDHGMLREAIQRGHAIGVHGHDHANRTPFAPAAERLARLGAGCQALTAYGAGGYRAPSLLRTRALLEDVARFHPFDSSIPTSGGLFPTPNNGCASARPFAIGSLIEIPLSLPRDGSLRFLGHSAAEISDLWIACARTISQSGGAVVLLTHCEDRFSGNPEMLQAYERFPDFIVASPEFTWSTFEEVLRSHAPGRDAFHSKCA
jgi:peptidoglycan/xylan/chitin deacetylase (PgdA/CDA1 family)